jgi:hypothetical protein
MENKALPAVQTKMGHGADIDPTVASEHRYIRVPYAAIGGMV